MRTSGKILYGIFIAVLFGVAGLFVVSLMPLGNGLQMKIVKSGSMEPAIHTGSLAVVMPQKSYGKGDIITFGEDSRTKVPTTHRIVSVEETRSGNLYTTKGDANEEADSSAVAHSDVLGRVIIAVPYVGYILDFARQPLGFAFLIAVPAAMIIIDEVFNIYREVGDLKRRKLLRSMPIPRKPRIQPRLQPRRLRLPTI